MNNVLNKLYKSLIVGLLIVTVLPISLSAKETIHKHGNDSYILLPICEGDFSDDYYHSEGIELQNTIEKVSCFYYLNNTTVLEGDISIDTNCVVTICLNGNILDMNGHTITNHGELTICDCKHDENIIHYFDKNTDGSWQLPTNTTSYTTSYYVKGGVL